MRKIGIEVNGVLRDTIGKFKQLYEKHMVDEKTDDDIVSYEIDESGNTSQVLQQEVFNYEIISDVTSLDLTNHFRFKDEEELYSFMYEDFAMQIFGHAGSTETFTFNDLNEFYLKHRDEYEILIVSDEVGKSKPATLFFLSKFGCLIEKIKFYSKSTIDSMWDEIDVLLTANPDYITNTPEGKTIVKYKTEYNKNIETKYEIDVLKGFDEIIQKITIC
jgi:hypothetical protein